MSEQCKRVDDAADSGSDYLDSTLYLISRARDGDREAIERLFARHLKPLQRWASGRLPKWARDLADTDDLVQETLLQTFKRIGEFEPRRVGALQAYLRMAVLNRLRDELRRQARRPDAIGLESLTDVSARSPLEEAIGRQAVEEYEERSVGWHPRIAKRSSRASSSATPTRSSRRRWANHPRTRRARQRVGRCCGWLRR
jgi:RNA polymerase sigma factor (sigma-70 family)